MAVMESTYASDSGSQGIRDAGHMRFASVMTREELADGAFSHPGADVARNADIAIGGARWTRGEFRSAVSTEVTPSRAQLLEF